MQKYGGVKVQLHTFLTLALGGGDWSAHAALPLEKEPPVPIEEEASWALEPVWTL